MNNPHRGEVTFEAGGKTYVFKLGVAAQVAIEQRMKQPIHKLLQDASNEWGIFMMLVFMHAGLLRQYALTEDEVADIIDELGLDRASAIIAEALKLAFGEADKTNAHPMRAKATRSIGARQ